MPKTLFTGDVRESDTPNYGEKRIKVGDKYYITGDIVPEGTPNYGEKRMEIGGGGGGSDFSTATLTLVNNIEDSNIYIHAPFVDDYDDILFPGFPAISGTYAVVLYKNELGAEIWDNDENSPVPETNMVVTGDIVIESDGAITITGDGTLTLAVPK